MTQIGVLKQLLLSSVCALALTAAAPKVLAQDDSSDDEGWITGLIENAVSNDEMTVRLSGFEGALSSEATADTITIADPDGIWLRLDGLVFDWNRTALLSGRVEIENLSAERIELLRLPQSSGEENTVPSAEAAPFSLPDLPVSVNIGEVSAAEIVLTEDLLGEPVTARFIGALTLADGAGDADILLERTDGKTGAFDVEASYDNDGRALTVALLAEEGEDGIAARMIGLPGTPSVRLEVSGDAPLDDFTAQISLATDDVDRITGSLRLFRPEETQDQAFDADLSGDLTPFLDDAYAPFFGTQSSFLVSGTVPFEGGLDLSELAIEAEQITLSGSAELDAQNWPTTIDLSGSLGAQDGSAVLLPLTARKPKSPRWICRCNMMQLSATIGLEFLT